MLAPGIAAIWRITTIRQTWQSLDFRDKSKRIDSALLLLTSPVAVSAAVWCLIIITNLFAAWLSAGSKHGLALVASILGALVLFVVLVPILISLPIHGFLVRHAHPMLEPIFIMAVTCAIGLPQLLHPDGGSIPPHVDRLIALGSLTSMSTICIVVFLTLYWLGLRLNYIPVKHMDERLAHEPTSAVTKSLHGDPRPRHIYRRKSSSSAVIITLAATVIMVWIVAQVVREPENISGGSNSKSSTEGAQGKPLQGILTVVPNHDYDLYIRPPYSVARTGEADVGELTGTSSGLEIYLAYALPLTKTVKENYASCLSLNWMGANVWSTHHIIPWSQLRLGNQFCIEATMDGAYISLLTVVKQPDNDRVSFSVATWLRRTPG